MAAADVMPTLEEQVAALTKRVTDLENAVLSTVGLIMGRVIRLEDLTGLPYTEVQS